MPRPDPNRKRRRPGRRPPHHHSLRPGSPKPGGFTAGPFGPFYRVLLPGLRGGEMKQFFNAVSRAVPLGLGVGGAVLSYAWLGPLGAALGLGGGLAAGASFAESQRFYRR